ncbi:hypothetical protein H8D30_04570 [bacterium]|nr:hypothetical protein [bacterium]
MNVLQVFYGLLAGGVAFGAWIPLKSILLKKKADPKEGSKSDVVGQIGRVSMLHFLVVGGMIWALKTHLATPSGIVGFGIGTVLGLSLLSQSK